MVGQPGHSENIFFPFIESYLYNTVGRLECLQYVKAGKGETRDIVH